MPLWSKKRINIVFFCERLLTALVGLLEPLSLHSEDACLVSGSKSGTQVSSPVTMRSRRSSTCRTDRRLMLHISFLVQRCSAVSWWGTNFALSFDKFRSFFRIRCTEAGFTPLSSDSSAIVILLSCSTSCLMVLTCCALALGRPGLSWSVTGVVWSLLASRRHHMRTWVLDIVWLPNTDLSSLQISMGFIFLANMNLRFVLWSSLCWFGGIVRVKNVSKTMENLTQSTNTCRSEDIASPHEFSAWPWPRSLHCVGIDQNRPNCWEMKRHMSSSHWDHLQKWPIRNRLQNRAGAVFFADPLVVTSAQTTQCVFGRRRGVDFQKKQRIAPRKHQQMKDDAAVVLHNFWWWQLPLCPQRIDVKLPHSYIHSYFCSWNYEFSIILGTDLFLIASVRTYTTIHRNKKYEGVFLSLRLRTDMKMSFCICHPLFLFQCHLPWISWTTPWLASGTKSSFRRPLAVFSRSQLASD